MIFEMKKIKPSIHQMANFCANFPPGKEVNWGWYDLKELATIVKIDPAELAIRYINVSKKKWGPSWDKNKSLIMITNWPYDDLGDVIGYNHEDLTKIIPYTGGGIRRIDFLLKGWVFIPAGWGLAVLEEVKKGKP